MKRIFQQHNIYTLFWCLYFLQGTLYPAGSVIPRMILMAFLFLSMFYVAKVYTLPNKPTIFKPLNALVLMFGLYGLLRLVSGSGEVWLAECDGQTYIKKAFESILPIYAFYYFSFKGRISNRWLIALSAFLIVVILCKFYYMQALRMELKNADEVTNNAGYMFLALFPIVALIKKPTLQYVFLAFILVYIFMAMKRGAIFIAIICMVIFITDSLRKQKLSRKLLIAFLLTLVLLILYRIVSEMIETSVWFNHKLQQTEELDGNGRNELYPIILDFIKNQTNVWKILFGNGADATLKYIGQYAHNDWLEIFINQGLIGLCIYTWYWITLVRTWIEARKTCSRKVSLALLLFLVIYFCRSLFSMSINSMGLYSTSAIGFCLYEYQLMNQQKKNVHKSK